MRKFFLPVLAVISLFAGTTTIQAASCREDTQWGENGFRCGSQGSWYPNSLQCKRECEGTSKSEKQITTVKDKERTEETTHEINNIITLEFINDNEYGERITKYKSGDAYSKIFVKNAIINVNGFTCTDFSMIESIFNDIVGWSSNNEISLILLVKNAGAFTGDWTERAQVVEIARFRKTVNGTDGSNCDAIQMLNTAAPVARVRAESNLSLQVGVMFTVSKVSGYDVAQLVSDTAGVLSNNMVGALARVAPIVGPVLSNSNDTLTNSMKSGIMMTYDTTKKGKLGKATSRIRVNGQEIASFEVVQEDSPMLELDSQETLNQALSNMRVYYLGYEESIATKNSYTLREYLILKQALPNLPLSQVPDKEIASYCEKLDVAMSEQSFSNLARRQLFEMYANEFNREEFFRKPENRNVCGGVALGDSSLHCPETGDISKHVNLAIQNIRKNIKALETDGSVIPGPLFEELGKNPNEPNEEPLEVAVGARQGAFGKRCYHSVSGANAGNKQIDRCTYVAQIKRDDDRWQWIALKAYEVGAGIKVDRVSLGIDPSNYSGRDDLFANNTVCQTAWQEAGKK